MIKETAKIYNRRSQDRDERQQNSLETQLNNTFDTLEKYDLELIGDPISESVSAKTEFTRSGFNRLIDECKKGKIDYIIVDEPKRLSRNNIDSSRIIDLMDKKHIKGLLTTSREYYTKHPRDKFFLQFDLSISKMDNEERGIDVSKKMLTALNRGQWLSKAIFGYRNVTIKKGHKDVEVVEKEANLVVQAFTLRAKRKGLKEIANYMTLETGKTWNSERVSKMLKNTKYYGLQIFGGQEALLDSPGYRPLVSKELFDKVNGINIIRKYKHNPGLPRYFSGILKDTDGNNLYPYEKKGKYIYYHSKNINIGEKLLFKAMGNHIAKYNFPKPFIVLAKATLRDYYKDKLQNRTTELQNISKELRKLKKLSESLLEKYLEESIDKKTYEDQKVKYIDRIEFYEEKKRAIQQGDNNVIKIIEDMCELVENLSETYKNGNDAKKGKIIRAMQCELFVNTKKELTIKDNKLFEIVKSLNSGIWYSHGELNSGLSLEKAAS